MFVGMELTFANAYTTANIKETGLTTATVDTLNDFMDKLGPVLERKLEDEVTKFEAKLVTTSQKNFATRSADVKNLLVTLTLNDELAHPFDADKANIWWFNVSIDPGVIEVQTGPAYWDATGPEDAIIETAFDAIFEVIGAWPLGKGTIPAVGALTPTAGAGGGHVNIDTKSAGITRSDHIVELIRNWEAHRKGTITGNATDLIEVSAQSQAVLSATRFKDLFQKGADEKADRSGELSTKLSALKSQVSRARTWTATKTALTDLFWQFPQVAIVDDNNPGCVPFQKFTGREGNYEFCRRTVLHNQAINVEHVELVENEIAGRVEFREFRAQSDVAEVTTCINLCRTLIASTRPTAL